MSTVPFSHGFEVTAIHSSRTHSAIRRNVWRTRAVMISCGLVICVFCTWFGVQAATPFVKAARLHAANDEIEHEILQYKMQNQQAEKEVRGLQTNAGIMTAARKLGYVLPNEQHLRIPGN